MSDIEQQPRTLKWKKVDDSHWTANDGKYIIWSHPAFYDGTGADQGPLVWTAFKRWRSNTIRLIEGAKTRALAEKECLKDILEGKHNKTILNDPVTPKDLMVEQLKVLPPKKRLVWYSLTEDSWESQGGEYQIHRTNGLPQTDTSLATSEYYRANRIINSKLLLFDVRFKTKEVAMGWCQRDSDIRRSTLPEAP